MDGWGGGERAGEWAGHNFCNLPGLLVPPRYDGCRRRGFVNGSRGGGGKGEEEGEKRGGEGRGHYSHSSKAAIGPTLLVRLCRLWLL